MNRSRQMISALLALLLSGAAAAEDAPRPADQGEQPSIRGGSAEAPPPSPGEAGRASLPGGGVQPELRMRYQGVAPGRTDLPPSAPAKLPLQAGPQRLTWPGFQIRDGKPTVFLQLTGPIQYSVGEKPGQLVVTLHNAVVSLRNNRRPILTEEFGTPVQRITVIPHKGSVDVAIAVRGEVAHREHMDSVENGYSMLLVEVLPAKGGEAAEVPSARPAGPVVKARAPVPAAPPAAAPPLDDAPPPPPQGKPLPSVFDDGQDRSFRQSTTLDTHGAQIGGGGTSAPAPSRRR